MLYNIIICDDNLYYLNMLLNITEAYFNNKKGFECKIHLFRDYDDNYIDFIYKNRLSNPIFLLDIETPSGDGINIARRIKQLDPNIPILYITGHYKNYTERALNSCDMDGYINKFGDIETELINKYDKILEQKGNKYIFNIKGNNITYTIDSRYINYFTTGDKNQIIIVGYDFVPLYLSMNTLYKQLDYRFIRCHQSCIVNFENVKEFHIKSKIIYFKDGTSIDLIARDFVAKNKNWLCEHYMDKIVFK